MVEIGSSRIYNELNQLKDRFMSENIIDPFQTLELLSDAIRELQVSSDTISALEEKLVQTTMNLAKIKAELDKEQALMGEILRQAPTGIVAVEVPSGKAIRVNRIAKMIMGNENVLWRSMEDHKPEGCPILFHLDKTPYMFEEMPLFRSVLHGETVTNEELIYIRKDGTQGILSVSSGPIFDSEAKMIAAVATFHNVMIPSAFAQRPGMA
jgi:signal transduction histidine kinase